MAAERARAETTTQIWNDPDAKPYIRIENVTKKFGDFVAVNDVSLNIYRGELFALRAEHPRLVDVHVPRDRVAPGYDLRPSLERAAGAVHAEEGLLHEVAHLTRGAEGAVDDAADQRREAVPDGLRGSLVAPRRGQRELVIGARIDPAQYAAQQPAVGCRDPRRRESARALRRPAKSRPSNVVDRLVRGCGR